MRKQSLLFLVLLTICFCGISGTQKAYATHAAGGELLYEWVRDSTYRIIFKFYRDCGSAQFPNTATAPTSVTVCYYNECSSGTSSVNLPRVPGPNGLEVSPGCPGFPTRCAFGQLPGYQEWIYAAEVTLPSRCHTWRFYTGVNARNQSINNLVNPGSQTLWVEATLNNEVAQRNSSPYFSVKPVPYVCMGMPYTYNNGAVDVNTDSLHFESIQPLTGSTACSGNPTGGTPIGYAGGYSLTEPFATGGTYSINTVTGQISFTPALQQMAVITTRVTEYRNGVKIGSVMRDIQVVVVGCNIPQPIVEIDTPSLDNAVLVGDRIEGCSGTQFSFCIDLKSPDTSAVLVTTDNSASAIPGATLTYNGQGTDSMQACIVWTPGFLDTGLKILTFTVKDSTCRPPGIPIMQTFVIPVYVWPATGILQDTALCPGDIVELLAVGGSNFQWDVLPGGSPLSSLSCTSCKNPTASPDRTTHYTVVADNSSVCNKDRDTVTVTVVTPPVIDVGPDVTTCINNDLQLDLNLPPDPGTDYQIEWTPATYLDDPSSPTPIAQPEDDITYYVVVKPNGLDHCNARDTINVTVLKGFELYNEDTVVCLGYTVTTLVTGDTRYTYTWTPAQGVSNTGAMAPQITPDSTRTYVVTASFPGCRDSIRSFKIEVQPVPTVHAGDDQILCFGDTLTLTPEILPPDYPFYTYTWDPAGALDPAPNVPNPVFTAYQTATLTLTVTTPAGCTGSDDILLSVVEPDIIEASNDTLICPGDTIQLHVWGTQVSQEWMPDYYISDVHSADPYVSPITSVTYTVYGWDIYSCVDTQIVHVRVLPRAVVSVPDSVRIFPGESYQLDPGGNCLYFEWFPPLGLSDHRIANPVAQPEVNTRYFVTGRTEDGCIGTDSIDVFVNLDSYIDVPNAFVPGTGPNNVLRPVRRGHVTLKSFAVYNRWGVKMFETRNLDEGWDGKFNGEPQPMGVYVYVVEATTPTGREFRKQGNTTLLR